MPSKPDVFLELVRNAEGAQTRLPDGSLADPKAHDGLLRVGPYQPTWAGTPSSGITFGVTQLDVGAGNPIALQTLSYILSDAVSTNKISEQQRTSLLNRAKTTTGKASVTLANEIVKLGLFDTVYAQIAIDVGDAQRVTILKADVDTSLTSIFNAYQSKGFSNFGVLGSDLSDGASVSDHNLAVGLITEYFNSAENPSNRNRLVSYLKGLDHSPSYYDVRAYFLSPTLSPTWSANGGAKLLNLEARLKLATQYIDNNSGGLALPPPTDLPFSIQPPSFSVLGSSSLLGDPQSQTFQLVSYDRSPSSSSAGAYTVRLYNTDADGITDYSSYVDVRQSAFGLVTDIRFVVFGIDRTAALDADTIALVKLAAAGEIEGLRRGGGTEPGPAGTASLDGSAVNMDGQVGAGEIRFTNDGNGVTLGAIQRTSGPGRSSVDPSTGAQLPQGVYANGSELKDGAGRAVTIDVANGANGPVVVRQRASDGRGLTIESDIVAGKQVNTNILIGNSRIGFSDAGEALGTVLGNYLTNGNVLTAPLASAGLKTLLGNVADLLDGTFDIALHGGGLEDVIDGALSKTGPELLANLKLAGIGAVSSYLTAELVNALGVNGFAGELANAAGGAAINTIVNNIVTITTTPNTQGVKLFTNVNLNIVGSAVGSFLGSKLANALVKQDTVGGQLGAAVGSSVASLAASLFIVSAAGGPVTLATVAVATAVAFVAAFIGNIIGGLIGSLFGGVPRSGADVVWDPEQGMFKVANGYSRFGGSEAAARGMATTAATAYNAVLAATGSTLLSGTDVQAGNYGTRKKNFVYRPTSTRDKEAITATFSGKKGPDQLVAYGVYQGLTDPDFALAGGNILVKRAIFNGLKLGGAGASFDLAELNGNIAVAKAFERYLQNSTAVGALLSAESDSVLAAEQTLVFARAVELGLTRRAASDWTGGFRFLLNELRTLPSGAAFYTYYDPYSDRISRAIDLGGYSLGDTIDVAGQDRIEGTASADRIDLSASQLMATNAATPGSNVGIKLNGIAFDGVAADIDVAATIEAGDGDDIVQVSDRGDNAFGGAGNDILVGGQLDDWLIGGDGDDKLFAGKVTNYNNSSAALTADGGDGNYLDGGAGIDYLYGSKGSDWLVGGAGTDTLLGGGSDDILDGGVGVDTLNGGFGGDDYIWRRGDGSETIAETSQALPVRTDLLGTSNWLGGNAPGSLVGEDAIVFGSGIALTDILLKRATNNADLLVEIGGTGGGTLTLTNWLNGLDQRIEWIRFAEGEAIRIGDYANILTGTSGNDWLVGSDGADFAYGGAGDDLIELLGGDDFGIGGDGNDTVAGDRGNDVVLGGSDDDQVLGGQGNDVVSGDAGNDRLYGGAGDDVITGGAGNDELVGGDGNDRFVFRRGDGHDTLFDAYTASGWEVVWRASVAGSTGVNGGWVNGFAVQSDATTIARNGDVLFDGINWNGVLDFDRAPSQIDNTLSRHKTGAVADLGLDRLEFGVGIDINDVYLQWQDSDRDGIADDLVLGIAAAGEDVDRFADIGDTIALRDWKTVKGIEQIAFYNTGNIVVDDFTAFDGGSDLGDNLTGSIGRDWLSGNGGDDVISGNTGDDILSGGGGRDIVRGNDGNDVLLGGSGDDILNGGLGADLLIGGSGSDVASYANATAGVTVNLANAALATGGGPDGDTLIAIEGLTGSNFADTLTGDAGDNLLTGGGSNDTLDGGDGNDNFAVDRSSGFDTITGGLGFDTVDITGGMLVRDLRVTSVSGKLRISYQSGTGATTNLADTTGIETLQLDSGPSILNLAGFVATVASGPVNLRAVDDLYFTKSTQIIHGMDGNDTLVSAGTGKLWGDNGDDVVLLTNYDITKASPLTTFAIVDGGVGFDTVSFEGTPSRNGPDTLALNLSDGAQGTAKAKLINIERLIGTQGVDRITGYTTVGLEIAGLGGNDVLVGGTAVDTIDGGEGADTISGGGGKDTLNGGAGKDLVSGGANEDLILGGDDDDSLRGLQGADFISGDAGDDVIEGGNDSDQLSGGDGDDKLFAGTANAGFTADTGADVAANTLDGGGGSDRLFGSAGVDTLLGGAGADFLYGNAGDDILNGGVGDDELRGEAGADIYQIDGAAGRDILIDTSGQGNAIEVAQSIDYKRLWYVRSGVDLEIRVLGASSITLVKDFFATATPTIAELRWGDLRLRASNIALLMQDMADAPPSSPNDVSAAAIGTAEKFWYDKSLTSPDVIIGTDTANTLVGSDSADDRIYGRGGDDIIYGYGGNDQLDGWTGNDTLDGGAGADALFGGAGVDALGGGDGDDLLYGGTENDSLSGGAGADKLYGEAGNDTLLGGTEGDILYGGDGDDELQGGADVAIDTLYGEAGNDTLFGGGGDDVLDGGDGDDTLTGGSGADILIGGNGIDTVTFAGSTNGVRSALNDLLPATGGATDSTGDTFAGIENLTGSNLADTLYGDDGANVLHGGGGADRIDGYQGNDQIFGDAGADIVYGLAGDDLLDGGTENDQLDGGTGNDRLLGGAGADRLAGGDGDDVLDGGAGNDMLIGGEGSDSYIFGLNSGNDTIDNADSGGFDAVSFYVNATDKVAYDRIWFERAGNDLLISALDGNTRVTVTGWYLQPAGDQKLTLDAIYAGSRYTREIDVQPLVAALQSVTKPAANAALPGAAAAAISSAWKVDSAPVVAVIADQTLIEDTVKLIDLTVTDPDQPGILPTVTPSTSSGDIQAVVEPFNGALRLRLTPAQDRSGADVGTVVVTLRATDLAGNTTDRQFNVTIQAQDDPTTLSTIGDRTGQAALVEDQESIAIPVYLADVDTEVDSVVLTARTEVTGDAATFAVLRVEGYGTDRTLVLKPAANANTLAAGVPVVIEARRGSILVSTTRFLAAVTPVADAPMVDDISVRTLEEVPITITVGTNAHPGDAAIVSQTVTGLAAHGTVTDQGGGRFVYSPAIDYNGIDSFTYRITDALGGYDDGTIRVTVDAMNDLPQLAKSTFDVYEGAPPTTLLGRAFSDAEVSDDPASWLSYPGLNNGITPDGKFRFDGYGNVYVNGNINYEERPEKTYTYSVVTRDAAGAQRTDAVSFALKDVNEAPFVSVNVTYSTGRGGPYGEIYYTGTTRVTYTVYDEDTQDTSFYINQNAVSGPDIEDIRTGALTGNAAGTIFSQNFHALYSDPLDTTIRSTVTIFDQRGASRVRTDDIHVLKTYPRGSPIPPVVLDLDGDGVELVSLATSTVRFDMDGNGLADRTGWVGGDDGLLALDRNGDGVIGSVDEFTFAQDVDGARSDLEGLRAYDSNRDGRFDRNDDNFYRFLVWRDANQDGVSQADELRGILSAGITSIKLDAQLTGASLAGASDNVLYGTSTYTTRDGSTRQVGDVFLAYEYSDAVSLPLAGSSARLAQAASTAVETTSAAEVRFAGVLYPKAATPTTDTPSNSLAELASKSPPSLPHSSVEPEAGNPVKAVDPGLPVAPAKNADVSLDTEEPLQLASRQAPAAAAPRNDNGQTSDDARRKETRGGKPLPQMAAVSRRVDDGDSGLQPAVPEGSGERQVAETDDGVSAKRSTGSWNQDILADAIAIIESADARKRHDEIQRGDLGFRGSSDRPALAFLDQSGPGMLIDAKLQRLLGAMAAFHGGDATGAADGRLRQAPAAERMIAELAPSA